MRKSTLSGITAVLLAGAMAAGVCCAGYASRNSDGKWFKNSDLSTWHWSDKSPSDIGNGDNDGNVAGIEDGVIVSPVESDGIELISRRLKVEEFGDYGISVQAESAQVLTATFSPANTTFQEVSWSVSGGQGKVTVNPVAGNPLQATVAVTGSFSERATVTCTADSSSSGNKTLTATSVVDYLKTPSFSWISSSQSPNCKFVNSVKNDLAISSLPFFENNTTGTLPATRASGSVVVYNMYYNTLKNRHSTVKEYVEYKNVDLLNNSFTFNFADLLGNVSDAEKQQIYREIAKDDVNTDIAEIYYSNYSFFYGDSQYSYYYVDGEDMIGYLTVKSWNDVIVFADSITLDQNGLVFFPPQA